MDESPRNQEIADLIEMWEWCSGKLHVKWQRRRKSRNSCLLALAYAISEPNFISPFKLTRIYKTLPAPLLDEDKVETFWNVQPVPLLQLGLGSFTKRSPLKAKLDRIRMDFPPNRIFIASRLLTAIPRRVVRVNLFCVAMEAAGIGSVGIRKR
jgi:hypothetical protein